MLLACVPLYIAELAPPQARGWLVDQVAVWNTFGYMTASWVGYGFFFYQGNGNEWRPPLCMGLSHIVNLSSWPWSSVSNPSCYNTPVWPKMASWVSKVACITRSTRRSVESLEPPPDSPRATGRSVRKSRIRADQETIRARFSIPVFLLLYVHTCSISQTSHYWHTLDLFHAMLWSFDYR
jgi:hypothetical protein